MTLENVESDDNVEAGLDPRVEIGLRRAYKYYNGAPHLFRKDWSTYYFSLKQQLHKKYGIEENQ